MLVGKREESEILLLTEYAHAVDEPPEDPPVPMLRGDDRIGELVCLLLLPVPEEPPGDRRPHPDEAAVLVEGAQDDPLAVGVPPVQPLSLHQRARRPVASVVEIVCLG